MHDFQDEPESADSDVEINSIQNDVVSSDGSDIFVVS